MNNFKSFSQSIDNGTFAENAKKREYVRRRLRDELRKIYTDYLLFGSVCIEIKVVE